MSNILPTSSIDLFSDANLLNPWPAYAELRNLGPAVWMEQGGFVALTRYAEVREALHNDSAFISGEGVALNDIANQQMKGTVIATDGADHEALRDVLSEQLSPRALKKLAADIQSQADGLIQTLVERGSFDVVPDLAQRFPSMVVVELIGLPAEGREKLLSWADNSFNVFGPIGSPRTQHALQDIAGVFEYAFKVTQPGMLRPGSMGAAIVDAVEAGKLPMDKAPGLMVAYLTGGLDTTIASICNAVGLFAAHPDQWEKIRADPSLIPGAYNEIIRYESPAHWFSRLTANDIKVGDVDLKAGTRVVPLFACANRDERKWADADRFDVLRAPFDHLGFGYGSHGCAGQGVARLEVHALLTALAKSVARFEVHTAERSFNNIVHGYSRLDVTLHLAENKEQLVAIS